MFNENIITLLLKLSAGECSLSIEGTCDYIWKKNKFHKQHAIQYCRIYTKNM